MKFVRYLLKDEEIQSIIENYYLRVNLPTNYESVEDIAKSVFTICEHLIPDPLLRLFTNSLPQEYKLFKKNLIAHLLLNKKLKILYNRNDFEQSNHRCFTTTINRLSHLRSIDGENNKRFLTYLNSFISKQFGLNKTNNKTMIPCFISNLIIYLTLNHLLYKDILKGNFDSIDKLLEFYNIYLDLIKNSLYSDIEYCIFEREFNLSLITEIIKTTLNEQALKKDDVYKHLSLACLLPDINIREQLVRILIDHKIELLTIKSEYGSYGNVGSFISSSNFNFSMWLELVDQIILKLALIAVPIMEICFDHLYNKIDQEVIAQFTKNWHPSPGYHILPDNILIQKDYLEITKQINRINKIYNKDRMEEMVKLINFDSWFSSKEDEYDYFENLIKNTPDYKVTELLNIANHKFMEILS